MKKIIVAFAFVFAFTSFAPATHASTLSFTQDQVNSLLSVLSAFNADEATMANVISALSQNQQGSGVVLGASTATPSCAFTRDLTVGSSGADVICLQKMLIAKGQKLPAGATGYFGPQTAKAVTNWQRAKGTLSATGYFGPKSRQAFVATGATVTTSTSDVSNASAPPPPAVAVSPITMAKNSGYVDQVFSPGTAYVKLGSFTLSADATEAQVVNTVTVTLSPSEAAMIADLWLRDGGTGVQIGTTKTAPSTSTSFSINLTIPVSGVQTIDLYGQLKTTASSGPWVASIDGSSVGAISGFPFMFGDSSSGTLQTITISSITGLGLKISLAPDSPNNTAIIEGAPSQTLAKFTFSNPTSANISVTSLVFARIGVSNDAALTNTYLYSGTTRLSAARINNGHIVFGDSLNNFAPGLFTLPSGGSIVVSVLADIGTNTSGQQVGVQLVALSSTGAIDSSASFPITAGYQTISTGVQPTKPTITSITSPNEGNDDQTITIYGTNLGDASLVNFYDSKGQYVSYLGRGNFISTSATKITLKPTWSSISNSEPYSKPGAGTFQVNVWTALCSAKDDPSCTSNKVEPVTLKNPLTLVKSTAAATTNLNIIPGQENYSHVSQIIYDYEHNPASYNVVTPMPLSGTRIQFSILRLLRNCATGAVLSKTDIRTEEGGYSNWTGTSHYQQQCIDDGTPDVYYDEARYDYKG